MSDDDGDDFATKEDLRDARRRIKRRVRRDGDETRELIESEESDTRSEFDDAWAGTRFLLWLLFVFIAFVAIVAVFWYLWYYPTRLVAVPGIGDRAFPTQPFEPTGLQPHQRTPLPQDVHEWRKAAWQRDDLFAELKLGDLYSQDQSFYDPVEAVVWYYLALRPDHDYTVGDDQARRALEFLWDKANRSNDDLLSTLTLEQREEARQRIIYVLACRGAEGFITLGRLHRGGGAEYSGSERAQRCRENASRGRSWFGGSNNADSRCDEGGDEARSALIPDDAESLMYFDIAQSLGHPLADAYVNTQTDVVTRLPNGPQAADTARSRAHNWLPAFEYYPGQTRGGILHTDECLINSFDEQAYLLVGQIPPPLIVKALWIVGVAKPPPAPCGRPCRPPARPPNCCELRDSMAKFQELIGHPQTGALSPGEIARLIRMAALDGDAELQNELGIMYTKGIGVPVNFPRAQNWFDRAGAQRFGEALYNLAILYKVGINGVPHDEDKASRLMSDAAIAGFNPAKCQLLYLLSQSARDRADRSENGRETP